VNPVEEFLNEVDELEKLSADDLRKRQQREFEMWQQWQQNGQKKKDLRPLLNSLKGFINNRANVYAGKLRDIPPAAIKAEFTNQAVNALQTYDPNRGAKLTTYIDYHLKKAKRFATTYQNPGRIPENRIYKIRELQNAEQQLDERLGRAPTQLEVADKLKWSPKQVDVLQRELRSTFVTGKYETDPSSYVPPRHKEVLRLLPYELNNEERQVFEYIYGIGGKPQLGPGAIAQKLGLSAPKVSRLKKSIAEKYEKYSK
jgi:DNA-directed RNA polymerase specialized sigma subunit